MIKPGRLHRGDKIAIIAPARKVSKDQVKTAVKTFEQWGLTVELGKNLFSEVHSYLAGSDEQRLDDLQRAINDSSIKAIIAARGGYGAGRIIDRINFSALQSHPKWIVGFSDITALHLKAAQQGLMSIHGTMPILFDRNDSDASIESLRQVLFHDNSKIEFKTHTANRGGITSGQLIGGNLSLVIDSLGTSSELDTEGKILIIEEIDEYVYRLDRMLNHLKRAGKFEKLKGLVVGHMTDIKESELAFNESFVEIVLNAVKDFQFPVAFNFPSGHENPNLAWIHGDFYELRVTESECRLKLQDYAL